jgi:anti-sigma regulatory factor (Ser/Thr protein kinase)
MSVVHSEFPQREGEPGRGFNGSWNQQSVRDLEHASHAADRVLLDLKRAGYSQRDLAGMRVALREAIGNALESRSWRPQQDLCLAVRYRINRSYVAVEVEVHGTSESWSVKDGADESRQSRLPKPRPLPCVVPYLTWIRYSRKDHSATLCQCSVLR